MRTAKRRALSVIALLVVLRAATAQGQALPAGLTPVGAERAGNAAGSIPPWTGGRTAPGEDQAAQWQDPFAAERPVLIIDQANASQYAANLPEGALALFRRFADYRMLVYPTHRTAALPQPVYDAIARNAITAHAAASGIAFGVAGAAGGIPFPVPTNGAEAVWNHLLAFWGAARQAHVSTYIAPGDGTIERASGFAETTDFPFYAPGVTPATVGAYYFKTRRLQDAPVASVGEGYLAWQPLDVASQPFVAWRYLPGEHRTRRAPSLSYDTPDPDTSGFQSLDDYYLYFGGQDRYVFRLLGKREMFIPYGNNALALRKPIDAMGKQHARQDLLRYELHRVWVVEGTLAPGSHHVAPRRRLYLDEDTWLAVYSEAWDESGRLWKFGHATMMDLPAIPAVIGGGQFFYDLIQGGYCYAFAFEAPAGYVVTPLHPADTFEPAAMAADAVR